MNIKRIKVTNCQGKMKKRSCDECLLIFRKLGSLTSEDRLQTHKKHLHKIECQKCPRRFISMAHLQFHLESYHRTRYTLEVGEVVTCSLELSVVSDWNMRGEAKMFLGLRSSWERPRAADLADSYLSWVFTLAMAAASVKLLGTLNSRAGMLLMISM